MLKEKVDVGGRVYSNRPDSPLFLEEVPAICVTFGQETNEVFVGTDFKPKEYLRHLTLVITAAVDSAKDPDADINESQEAEDYLDWLMEQVEHAVEDDWRLAKRLTGYSPTKHTPGLTHGSKQTTTATYEVTTDDERRLLVQDTTYVFPYITHTYRDKRLPDFLEYYAALIRVGSNEETVDRVLLDAEGELSHD
jgi:hypothetical protein